MYSLISFIGYARSHTGISELSPSIFLQCFFARTLIRPLLDNKEKTCQNVMPVTQSSIDPSEKRSQIEQQKIEQPLRSANV